MSTSILPGERPDRMEEECAVFGVSTRTGSPASAKARSYPALRRLLVLSPSWP